LKLEKENKRKKRKEKEKGLYWASFPSRPSLFYHEAQPSQTIWHVGQPSSASFLARMLIPVTDVRGPLARSSFFLTRGTVTRSSFSSWSRTSAQVVAPAPASSLPVVPPRLGYKSGLNTPCFPPSPCLTALINQEWEKSPLARGRRKAEAAALDFSPSPHVGARCRVARTRHWTRIVGVRFIGHVSHKSLGNCSPGYWTPLWIPFPPSQCSASRHRR
jgi:hypothetical protein